MGRTKVGIKLWGQKIKWKFGTLPPSPWKENWPNYIFIHCLRCLRTEESGTSSSIKKMSYRSPDSCVFFDRSFFDDKNWLCPSQFFHAAIWNWSSFPPPLKCLCFIPKLFNFWIWPKGREKCKRQQKSLCVFFTSCLRSKYIRFFVSPTAFDTRAESRARGLHCFCIRKFSSVLSSSFSGLCSLTHWYSTWKLRNSALESQSWRRIFFGEAMYPSKTLSSLFPSSLGFLCFCLS